MYTEQSFTIPALTGLSEQTITEHKKLYAGYVKHANLIVEHMASLSEQGDVYTYETAELQRRFAFEWAGMRNHEIYFSLLENATPVDTAPMLKKQIETQWGSIDGFISRFQSLALTRGIGWAMLYWDTKTQSLVLGWVDEQHIGQLADCAIIIALDMWEHSYVADYQPSGKKQYVLDFISQMNWSSAETNFVRAQRTNG